MKLHLLHNHNIIVNHNISFKSPPRSKAVLTSKNCSTSSGHLFLESYSFYKNSMELYRGTNPSLRELLTPPLLNFPPTIQILLQSLHRRFSLRRLEYLNCSNLVFKLLQRGQGSIFLRASALARANSSALGCKAARIYQMSK